MRYASALGVFAITATFAVSGLAQDAASPKVAKPELPTVGSSPLNASTTDVPAVVQPAPATGVATAPVAAPAKPRKIVLPVSAIPDELKSKVSIAAQHVRTSQIPEALALYTEVLNANADLFTVAFERGKVHQQMKDHAKAIADFSAAVAKSPEHYEAYFGRCVSYQSTGAFAQALADCEKAIQLNPTSADYYHYRGLAHMSLKNWDKAVGDFSSSIDINPDQPEIHLLLAKIYSDTDHLIHALREYTIVLQQKPGHPDAYKGRSAIKAMLGDNAGSQEDLKKIAR
jgi:tetratricopeptide (TPR) repeat protein